MAVSRGLPGPVPTDPLGPPVVGATTEIADWPATGWLVAFSAGGERPREALVASGLDAATVADLRSGARGDLLT